MRVRVSTFVFAAFTIMLAGPSDAEAALIAWVCNTQNCSGAGDVMVVDEGAGDGLTGTQGAVLIAGDYFGYEVVVSTSESKPAIGSAELPSMTLSYTLINSTGTAGSIWLYATDTDFTGEVDLTASLDGDSSNGTFSLVSGVWGGSSNTSGDISNLLIALGPIISNPFSASGQSGTVGGLINPYSLTIGVQMSTDLRGTTRGTLELAPTSVPEPSVVVLLGSGLLAAGVRRWRQLKA